MEQGKQEENGIPTQHTDGLSLIHYEIYRMSSCFDANNRNIHTQTHANGIVAIENVL